MSRCRGNFPITGFQMPRTTMDLNQPNSLWQIDDFAK